VSVPFDPNVALDRAPPGASVGVAGRRSSSRERSRASVGQVERRVLRDQRPFRATITRVGYADLRARGYLEESALRALAHRVRVARSLPLVAARVELLPTSCAARRSPSPSIGSLLESLASARVLGLAPRRTADDDLAELYAALLSVSSRALLESVARARRSSTASLRHPGHCSTFSRASVTPLKAPRQLGARERRG